MTAALVAVAVLLSAVGGWWLVRVVSAPDDDRVSAVAAPAGAVPSPSVSSPSASSGPSATASAQPSARSSARPSAPSSQPVGEASDFGPTPVAKGTVGVTAADAVAGVRSSKVPDSAGGKLAVVPGSVAAPGKGKVLRIRVEVERGLDVDTTKFAAFVMATLNDSRSWGHGGRYTFARTSGTADLRVVLASPNLSARMCRPLNTGGTLSCANGTTAILTTYRWVRGTPDYGTDRSGYRRYLVNHEVGHTLGHHHEYCAGKGKRAPVMMQQTKGLKGCTKNSWPYP